MSDPHPSFCYYLQFFTTESQRTLRKTFFIFVSPVFSVTKVFSLYYFYDYLESNAFRILSNPSFSSFLEVPKLILICPSPSLPKILPSLKNTFAFLRKKSKGEPSIPACVKSVSYTHLDVYKRQAERNAAAPDPQAASIFTASCFHSPIQSEKNVPS